MKLTADKLQTTLSIIYKKIDGKGNPSNPRIA